MLIPRVIPCLLLKGLGLVKTRRFKDPVYLGDPRNTIKIFNEKEVDELVVLDILATREGREPNYELLSEMTSECFMPLGYGGGITNLKQMEKILQLGVEKVVVNSHAVKKPELITEAAKVFGGQSVVVSIDVKQSLWGRYEVVTRGGGQKTGLDPVEFALRMEGAGAGEILLNSVDLDGSMAGYDIRLIQKVSHAVSVPVIACGGGGRIEDFRQAVHEGGASAVAAGSMFVFQGKHRAVLINFPKREQLEGILQ